jgi:glycosidase
MLPSNWITSSTYMWIDIRSYQDSDGDGIGDIRGLISRLDYLAEIGTGAIMIPDHQPTDFAYGGTMQTDFCSVDPRLGTLNDFNELIRQAHERKIAVISGWTPYSTHPDHLFFQASRNKNHPDHKIYRDYYLWTDDLNTRLPHPVPRGITIGHWEWDEIREQFYHAIWKTADGTRWCPETNPYSSRMVEENEKMLRFWLDRGLDGFWVDCADKGDFKNYRDHTRFWRKMTGIIHFYGDRICVGEDGTFVEETIGQEGFDQFWCGSKPVPVNKTVFQEGSPSTLVLGPKGQEHQGIHEILISFYNTPKGNQCSKRYSLSQTTDFQNPTAVARVKQYFALALTLPIVPLFIMGTECGFELSLRTNVWSTHYFMPMMWDHSKNHGFTTGTPFVTVDPADYPKNRSVEDQLADKSSILSCYKELALLRKDNPSLQSNEPISSSYVKVPTQNDQKYFAYLRCSSDKPKQKILVVINLVDTPREVTCDFRRTKHRVTERFYVVDLVSGKQEATLEKNSYPVRVPLYGFRILELKEQ